MRDMERLLEGFRIFKADYWERHRGLFESLAQAGQAPRALVIGCSDSRVDPQLLFQTVPGEIFAVRNVANLVPPYAPDAEYHGTSAALEFAVCGLAVEHVVVLGHSRCGGIAALLQGPAPGHDFVLPWMGIAATARERALAHAAAHGGDRQLLCEREGIKVSLENLRGFPWIRAALESGRLALHGWHFDIENGTLTALGPDGNFAPV